MNSHNFFVKFLNKINNFINSLLERNLKKLNSDNLKKLLINNKIFLFIVLVIILFFSYLSIPNIFNQSEISAQLKKNLLNELNLEFNFEKKLNYKFLPRPHFITNESSLIFNESKVSKINELKIYVSLENLFSLKNMKVKNVIIEEANFNLNKKNYGFFIKLLDSNFKDIKLEVINSNIFYRNLENDVLFINKIIKNDYYFDLKNLKNIAKFKNEIFNIPYLLELSNDNNKKKVLSKLNLSFLKLQIENTIAYHDNNLKGSADIILNQNKSKFIYELKKNTFIYSFFEKLNDPNFNFNGDVNLSPFYSKFEGNTKKIDLSYLFKSNSLFSELIKTGIFNNKNLNFNLNFDANKLLNYQNIKSIIFNSKIQEGLIDFDKTKFSWKEFVNFEILDSLMYIQNNELILDGKLNVIINNSEEVYKSLLTPKNYRNEIKEIKLYFNYNFDKKKLALNDILIDNEATIKLNNDYKNLDFNKDKLQNKIYFKKFLNEAIKSYAG